MRPIAGSIVALVTPMHDDGAVDYDALVDEAQLVVDLRNATGANGRRSDKVWKL